MSIALVVVVSMLTLALAVIGLGWWGVRASLLEVSSRSARDAGLLITEKSYRMLEPAQATLRMLSASTLADASHLEERLTWLKTLSSALSANPLIAALYVGYRNGDSFLLRSLELPALRALYQAPEHAMLLVQSVEMDTSGQSMGTFLFFDRHGQLLEQRQQRDYRYDPRTRAWYQSAQASPGASAMVTGPYVLFTTQQLGLTLSQASPYALDGNTDTNAQHAAIFGVDIVLDDLAVNFDALHLTPNTQLALVNAQTHVLAYRANGYMSNAQRSFEFETLDSLHATSLSALNALQSSSGQVQSFTVDGQEWQGLVMPFHVWQGQGLRLLLAFPSSDLLGELQTKALFLVIAVCVLALMLMPLGWFAGGVIGHSVEQLTHLAQRMAQFDFSSTHSKRTYLREVNDLSRVMTDMGQTIEDFLQISHDIAQESQVERMLSNVLGKMVTATRCLGGAVYLYDAPSTTMRQACVFGQLEGHQKKQFSYTHSTDTPDQREALNAQLSELRVSLEGRNGGITGMLVLQHPQNAEHADIAFTKFVRKLSGMLAVSIETRQLIEAQKQLLDAFVRVMADAIDAKSPYTGGHCDRVPQLAGMLIDRLVEEKHGPYAPFQMNEEERYEFHLGTWLHDCGKVTSPEHIIDKSTKLETIYNRIHEVRMRFEVLWRDAEIDYWKALLDGRERSAQDTRLSARQEQLRADFAFVAKCNIGGESMADADIARLQRIGQTPWLRHFDNRLGLSTDALRHLENLQPEAPPLPQTEFLIADRSDHLVPWGERKPPVEKNDPQNRHGFDMKLPAYLQNLGELHNLSIRKGTLTEEDRFRINDHIVQTLIMLRSLPWPQHLMRVPDIAVTHHERLDGKGYPRKLGQAQLTLPDRVMAVADIFEALTAADRPYKKAKTLSESLRIMAFMAREKHLDADLLRYFLESEIWLTFAQKHMTPEQIDTVDLDALEQILASG